MLPNMVSQKPNNKPDLELNLSPLQLPSESKDFSKQPISKQNNIHEPRDTQILNSYKLNLIDKITIFCLKAFSEKTYANQDLIQNTRLLACIISNDLEKYEKHLYQFYSIPVNTREQYSYLLAKMEQPSDLEDKLNILIVLASSINLDYPIVISRIRMLVNLIIQELITRETELAKNLLLQPALTVDEYQEIYEEKSIGCWR